MAQRVTYGSRAGRWVLLATILASGIAQLDATVVNVALPRIGRNLHIGLTSLQWTVNAYALTLSGLLLLGGSLGDRFGRRRIFVLGVIWFTAASLGCALAPSGAVLIAMRAVQGVGGAMLTPGSLAILEAVFEPDDRAPAVGAWSGLTGVASALGPVVGGLLVAVAPWGWRLVFLINLPLAAAVVFAARHIPETRDESAEGRIDVVGAALAAIGLAAVIYGLTEGSTFGWGARQLGATIAGVVLLAIFAMVELRERTPMLPMRLFRSQQFSAANAVTIVVYGSLGGVFFLLPVELQQGAGFSALGSRRFTAAGHGHAPALVGAHGPVRSSARTTAADDGRPDRRGRRGHLARESASGSELPVSGAAGHSRIRVGHGNHRCAADRHGDGGGSVARRRGRVGGEQRRCPDRSAVCGGGVAGTVRYHGDRIQVAGRTLERLPSRGLDRCHAVRARRRARWTAHSQRRIEEWDVEGRGQ